MYDEQSFDQISDDQIPEMRHLREGLEICFSETVCFLLPPPGLDVTTRQSFVGRINGWR
jgi:hypothetical protein